MTFGLIIQTQRINHVTSVFFFFFSKGGHYRVHTKQFKMPLLIRLLILEFALWEM